MQHLVLILHGFTLSPSRYDSLKALVSETLEDAHVIVPSLGMGTFSTQSPHQIVVGLLKELDELWQGLVPGRTGPMPRIVIIGHSMGALIARKLYIVACGENPEDAPFEKEYGAYRESRPWAANVERVILLAGMNRGWTVNTHLYTKTAILARLGIFIGIMLKSIGKMPFAFTTKRGTPFVTQLRIQWLSMLKHIPAKQVGNALVIQALGTRDDLVSPEDNVDTITGRDFIYVEIKASDHISILEMNKGPKAGDNVKTFRAMLTGDRDTLKHLETWPYDITPQGIDDTVTDVVFVIHSIRDTGYWTQKVAARVRYLGKSCNRKFATETSTYGYFAMLPFLLPLVRRRKVEWLMDQYTENLALYPKATFSFVGHSNGTYLLYNALKKYPACKFKHVVFAGSVVSTGFDVNRFIREGRIKKFSNFIATSDWVVAIFPKAFQTLRLQDIGSGGVDGFTCGNSSHNLAVRVNGGHGAATAEHYWDSIADFIVNGTAPVQETGIEVPNWMSAAGRTSPLPFALVLLVVLALAVGIFFLPVRFEFMVVLLLVYAWLIWKVITKL